MVIAPTAEADGWRPILARRPSRRWLIGLDAAAALAYTAALLLTGSTGAALPPQSSFGGPSPWEELALVAAAAAPIAFRRIRPLPVFAVVAAVTAVAVARDAVRDPFLPAAFTLFTVAVTRTPRRWWERWLPGLVSVLLCAAGALGAIVRGGPPYWRTGGPGLFLLGVVALVGAWDLGRATRQRRASNVRVAEHLAQRAVTQERLRIARELHDVVTHSMGLIAVKAGVANHVVHTRPEETHEALRVIEATSRDALADMRRMLGVLRPDAEGEYVSAALGPVPGPDALPELAARAGAELSMRGVEQVPEAVGLAVHRIVQEALTNVAKHAPPGTRCRVVVEAFGHEVRVEVSDDGIRRVDLPRPQRGHGIIGMRERVHLFGGTFAAGPLEGGGFAVTATLPYEEVR
ncbi:sensor histidine kinase [Streptodolium elevatio]|uniref:histidine kinase n=1 Tax=Streptodolium elevatio TaxID=3157996 RepID=A0ABV3DND4_9ACTN